MAMEGLGLVSAAKAIGADSEESLGDVKGSKATSAASAASAAPASAPASMPASMSASMPASMPTLPGAATQSHDIDMMKTRTHLLVSATRALEAVSACDICGRNFANSGAMKSHRRSCERAAQFPKPERKRRMRTADEPLLDWEQSDQLMPSQVDLKLWPGAAQGGWRVVPKYRGAAAKSHWSYVSPSGARLTSKSLAHGAAADGGASLLESSKQIPETSATSSREEMAVARARDEGLHLVRSIRSRTGFKCVAYNPAYRKRPFKVQVRNGESRVWDPLDWSRPEHRSSLQLRLLLCLLLRLPLHLQLRLPLHLQLHLSRSFPLPYPAHLQPSPPNPTPTPTPPQPHPNPTPTPPQVTKSGQQLRLGDFATASEAALCYARHLGVDASITAARLAASEEELESNAAAMATAKLAGLITEPAPPSETDVRNMAHTEGLQLVSARTRTGYKGVRRLAGETNKPFRAKVRLTRRRGYR